MKYFEKMLKLYWPLLFIGGSWLGWSIFGWSLLLIPWALGIILVGNNISYLITWLFSKNMPISDQSDFTATSIRDFTENPKMIRRVMLRKETPLTKDQWVDMIATISDHFNRRVEWKQASLLMAGLVYIIARKRMVALWLTSKSFDPMEPIKAPKQLK